MPKTPIPCALVMRGVTVVVHAVGHVVGGVKKEDIEEQGFRPLPWLCEGVGKSESSCDRSISAAPCLCTTLTNFALLHST